MGKLTRQSNRGAKKVTSRVWGLVFVTPIVILVIYGLYIINKKSFKESVTKEVESSLENGNQSVDKEGSSEDLEIGRQVSLPKNFPDDFPVYPDAQLTNAHESKGSSIDGISITWFTKGVTEDVVMFYEDKLQELGYDIKRTSQNTLVTISFNKNDLSGFVGITKTDNQSIIILVTLGIK
jgi:hypothetical protein